METSRLKQDIIAETVRNWIIQGKYIPGDKLPTDSELANHFLVNRCTVAAGLNRLAEEDLLDRAPKRGTVVKRQNQMPRTNAVALIANTHGEVYTKFARRINKYLLDHELYPVLMNELIDHYDEVTKFMRQMVKKSYPYGCLLMGDHIPYEELKKAPYSLFNTVFLLRYHYFEELPHAKYALLDYEDLGRQAIEFFAERNVKRILFPAAAEIDYVGAWASLQVTMLKHIQKYAAKEGIEVDESLFWRLHGGAPLNTVLPDAVRSSKVPTGIFAWSDSIFNMNIFPVLEQMGKDPLNDFVILGNFNTKHSAEYGFSSFDPCVDEIARIGVEMLTNEITEKKILLPPKLIIRTNIKK